MSKTVEELNEEIEALQKVVYDLHKEVITQRQHFEQRTVKELSGYVTIPNLSPASAAQLDDSTVLVVETGDGTRRAYLGELLAEAPDLTVDDIPELPASKITSETLDAKRIPAAVKSSSTGVGFGGFRYTLAGTEAELFTS